LVREKLGARDARSWRFKFHCQTSGADLTRQQPLNNVARVTVQAMAAVLGGTQSLHTDGYDEALSTPTEDAARVAVATQNILREEAGLADVIDPLGGSFYVETLTERMEEKIAAVMDEVEAAGGMYAAVNAGMVQRRIGDSALAYQREVESGARKVVGVNCYRTDELPAARVPLSRPDPGAVDRQIARLKAYKEGRSAAAVEKALAALARAAGDPADNVFEKVVEAAMAGATHGEVCACLRREMGFGQPLVAA
jgi:methylmalonyl-CoA mutase N-terminal domain/subunit